MRPPMTDFALPFPDAMTHAGSRMIAWLGNPQRRLVPAGVALGLLVLVMAVAWSLQSAFSGDADPAQLRKLPARPEDIEKHGSLARTTLPPDDARKRNDHVAFEPRVGAIARPFAFTGSDLDRARAIQCLATAVLYEAGDDAAGQTAVAQVVLNRVRHPAFPATVCGVVYQGSQRKTGCQFTFTCDGSLLRRTMNQPSWQRARSVAESALSGHVDATVGLATHYHTNWVYPYWSPSLRKLAQVGTHLFFGWPGSWGAQGAFAKAYRGHEAGAPTIGGLTALNITGDAPVPSPGEPGILGLPQVPAKLPTNMGKVPLYGNKVKLVGSDGRSFGLLAPPGSSASQMVNAALALCGQPGPCRVNAWGNEDDIPGSYPLPALTRSTMVFEYVRSGNAGGATTRFDCARYPNKDPKTCLESSDNLPDVLSGVRFK
jgi:spore germination cell wall hydrolase CwlJ-like protein